MVAIPSDGCLWSGPPTTYSILIFRSQLDDCRKVAERQSKCH